MGERGAFGMACYVCSLLGKWVRIIILWYIPSHDIYSHICLLGEMLAATSPAATTTHKERQGTRTGKRTR